MKKNVRKFVGIILAVAQLLACITVMNVSAATPDEGVEVVTQLFKDEFNYEVGAMTYAGTNNTWEALASKSDPKNVTIVQDETGNKYANVASELTAEGIYWSHGMRKYFSKISSGKVRLSVDVLMTAENCGEIHMGAGWNTMRPMVQFKEGAFYVYQESDAVEHPSRKLITASLNEWYEVGVIADYDDLTYEVLISQNDKLLYRATGIPIKDTAHGFSYLRFKNNNNSEFWVDNVVVEKITKADRENVISGVYDTLDGYESLTDGGVPTGNLTSTGWEAGAYGIKTTSIENEDGNKYINVPSDGSSIQYQIADTAVTTGILRFKFSIKSTDYTGAFVEVHDSDAYNSGGPVAMHIHDGYIYTKAGFWDGTGTKIKMGGIAKDEWFDAELTYNLDKNTYSIQLSRDGEVFNCLRDLTINKYNSQEAHTLGIKVLRFRDWSTNGGATQIDNFEFEYLTSETEQDYIRTETKFDNYETLAEAITSPWAATYKGLGELSLVDSDNGKAVSFPVSDSNHGIQYNISGGFSSGEMVVNFSVKSNNANGGALVTFPSGTGQETGLVGLHMYKGAFTTYVTGYSTGNKSLGKITANEWYDISISLDMSNKLYSIQIKHDGEVVGGLSNIDLIKYCSIGDLMSYIGSIRFVDWGKGIGGSGYELDNFSLSYVNPESKKNFIVTEANFDSSDSLSAIKGWTYDSGVALSDNKLSLPSGLNAQKALPLTDTGKLKVEYTLNANGGGAEVLAVSTDGEFALATFEGLTEAVTVTNIIDLENYKVTYSVNGETETTVDIADKTSGGALYNVNAIKVANTGEAAITVDDLTVSSYIAKPTVSDDVIKVTDAFGKVISKGTIVNPGVSTIEIDFGTDIDSESAKTAISLTSNSGDTPTFTVSTRAGKSVLTFDKALKAEETYTLSVSTALESTNGEALETEYSYSFTTDKADIFAEISAPTVGTKAIYTVGQLNSGDTLKLNARVVNSTESNADAVFVVGYYKDGILENAQPVTTTIPSGAISFDGVEVVVGDISEIDEMKIFMWDSLSNVEPYCENLFVEDYLTSFTLKGEGLHHTQGIAVDTENGYMYQSIQQDIKKYDIETGEVVASVLGFGEVFGPTETIHIGDITFNPDDGLLYCSAFCYTTETAHIIILDPDKFTEVGMARNSEGLLKIAYLPISSNGYDFAYSYGIDGATFAPLAGASSDSKKYLYLGSWSNGYENGEYSIYFAYDTDEIKNNAVWYTDEMWKSGDGVLPEEVYFAHTGIKQYGPQTLTYAPDKNGIFANFYQDNIPGQPNYTKYLLDMSKAPTEKTLAGSPDATNKILAFGDYGTADIATGIKGAIESEGGHGMAYLGNGYYYITTTDYNANMDTPVRLYKFIDGEFVDVK